MDVISKNSCRVCLSESEFNVSLFGSYSRRTNMLEKLLVCLKIIVEESDVLSTICFKCAENVERYYDFTSFVKKSQKKLSEKPKQRFVGDNVINRHVTSFVREQVYDADYTFSFLEMPEEKKEKSSPFFSYFSPPPVKAAESMWKAPKPREDSQNLKRREPYKNKSRQNSRDLFDSQSPDVEEESKTFDWRVTPEDNIIKRVREKCFGRSEY